MTTDLDNDGDLEILTGSGSNLSLILKSQVVIVIIGVCSEVM